MESTSGPGTERPSRFRWWLAWGIAAAVVLAGVFFALRFGSQVTPLLDMTR